MVAFFIALFSFLIYNIKNHELGVRPWKLKDSFILFDFLYYKSNPLVMQLFFAKDDENESSYLCKIQL